MPEHGQVIFSGQTRAKAGDRGCGCQAGQFTGSSKVVSMSDGIQEGAGKHVSRSIGINGVDVVCIDIDVFAAVKKPRATSATRHNKLPGVLLEQFACCSKIAGVSPRHGFFFVAGQQIHAVAKHFGNRFSEIFHHRRVGKSHVRFHALRLSDSLQLFCSFFGAEGSLSRLLGARQIVQCFCQCAALGHCSFDLFLFDQILHRFQLDALLVQRPLRFAHGINGGV